LRLAVERLELPHVGLGKGQLVTLSAGAASQVPDGANSQHLLFALADAALYEAKQHGRNRVCVGMTTPADQQTAAANVR
jgi:PleD family two-component response regulator